MKLVKRILTKNDCYKAGVTIKPKGIMVHSVGCAQPKASVFIDLWDKAKVGACVHAFIDNTGVYQTLPWNYRAWHSASGSKGSANNTHISFECCEPAGHTYNGGTMIGYDVKKNEAFFNSVYKNAVELCAMLCKEYHLNPLADGVIICHSEGYKRGIASNHSDVMHWWPKHGKDMDKFRADVAAQLREEDTMTQEQFNTMMDVYFTQLATQTPSVWSAEARAWAEANGLITGDGNGGKQYRAFCTREQMVTFLMRLTKLLQK